MRLSISPRFFSKIFPLLLGVLVGNSGILDSRAVNSHSADFSLHFSIMSERAAAGEPLFDNQQSPVSLEIWGEGFHEAVSQIGRQTKITPLLSSLISTAKTPRKIYISAENLAFEQAVEWLARAGGCKYRVIGNDRLILTAGYDWLRERQFGVIIRNVETLVASVRPSDREQKLANFAKNIDELMKIVSLFEPLYRVRIEEHADGQIKINAQVPAELKPLFLAALSALEIPGDSPRPATPIAISPSEQKLIDQLSSTKVIANYRQRPLREVIADLRMQSGINIGFDQTGAEPPLISLELGEVNIQSALLALAKQLNLRSVELSVPRGVWLSSEPRQWRRMPSRKILWINNVELKVYNAAGLFSKIDSNAFAQWARLNLFPDIWQDPLASIFYHEPSGNLVVIAPAIAQQAVNNALDQIRVTAKNQREVAVKQ